MNNFIFENSSKVYFGEGWCALQSHLSSRNNGSELSGVARSEVWL